jgi:small-conductance mechanosensitive channel
MTDVAAAWADALERFDWLPPWGQALVLLGGAVGIALLVHALATALVRRAVRQSDVFWRSLISRTRRPARLALVLLAINVVSPLLPLQDGMAALLRQGLHIGMVITAGWASLAALDIAAAIHLRKYRIDVADNLIARKHLTQVRILRRAAATLIIVFTIAFALMTISGFRQWGVSLLAAGGAAGIIVGLALQPLLTNLIAGIQIALTQPIRIDDAVIVENEWGQIEEITATYVVVRIWDLRRMVLPLTWFIQNPFQNWTRDSATLIGSVFFYLDYAAPIEAMREKLDQIVRASPWWDGDTLVLQVTDLRERVIEVRCLASARNGGDAFDLRCTIREQMIAWLKAEHPGALPRDRITVAAGPVPEP